MFNSSVSRSSARVCKTSVKKVLRLRELRLEQLEERALLSVSSAEYAAIREAYPDLNLPESAKTTNIVEIQATDLTVENFKKAIDLAGKTTTDDLIVLRTTDDLNAITFTSASDEIEINIDSSEYGALNVVAFGSRSLTIDAAGKSRVLNITGGTTGLANLTITGGNVSNSGGGIEIKSSECTATNIVVSGNYAGYGGGGIFLYSGSLTVVNSEISNNGGHLWGGGIHVENDSVFKATNSTFSGNTAYCGGGVYVDSKGAFIGVSSTIAGNSAEYEGSGVYVKSDGSFTATNVLVSMNYAKNFTGLLSSASSNNFIGYDPSFVSSPVFDENGNLTNADTLDLHLRSDSSAIDVGSNAAVEGIATDLDGKSRVYGESVDVGAYEYQGDRDDDPFYYSTVVDTLNDSFDLNDDEWSLREALYYASKYETITFAENLSGTLTLTKGKLIINGALSINGDERITIDAQQNSSVFYIGSGTKETPVRLKGLTIQNGYDRYDDGGGIHLNFGTLTAENVVVSGNIIGVCVYNYSSFTAINSTISENSGNGVVVSRFGTFIASHITISNNKGSDGGGVFIMYDGSAIISNSTISGNTAIWGGGVCCKYNGTLTATNVTFTGNSAKAGGGGIYISNGSFTAVDSTISKNSAEYGGGGVLVNVKGIFTAYNTIISENFGTRGGGVHLYSSFQTFVAINSTIAGNTAGIGGGVYIYGGLFTATNTKIVGNVAEQGGGVWNRDTFTATNVVIVGNSASTGGGVFICYFSSFTATNVTISGNTASFGSGVYVDDEGTFTATNVVLAANYGLNLEGTLSSESSNNIIGFYPSFVCGPVFDEEGKLTNVDALDLHLRSDSIAIDAGSNKVLTNIITDLDGNSRLYGKSVDIGAYEYLGKRDDKTSYSPIVDTLNDSFDPNDGEQSLREAIFYASKYETITFAENLTGTITLTRGALTLDVAMCIDGAGRIVIDADQKSRVIKIAPVTTEKTTTLKGLTLKNGKTSADDSNAYYNYGDNGEGGGIFLKGGTLTILNTTISDNSSSNNGGGVYVCSGSFTAQNSSICGNKTITDNSSSKHGGGVYVDSGATFIATNVMIAGNSAGYWGGGVYLDSGATFTVTNVTITGNSAQYGSGVYASDTNLFVAYNSLIVLNATKDDVNINGKVNGTNNLSTYTDWLDDGNYEYDPTKPLFKNAKKGDYRLVTCSQAVDKGNDRRAYDAGMDATSTDLAGNPRFFGTSIDIGAYELDRILNAPTNLTLGIYNDSTKTITLNWEDNSNDETGFYVEYSTNGGKTWLLSQVTGANVTSRVARGVRTNVIYDFRVSATRDGEKSEWAYSETLNTKVNTPASPSDLTSGDYDATSRTVSLNWQDNSNNETGFRVEYSTDDGKTWRLSQIMSANVTSRVAWGVKTNATYNFRVCALQGALKSKWAYSETLDTSEDAFDTLCAPDDSTFALPCSGDYALALPVAVPLVKQAAVRDVAFEDFARNDAFGPFYFSDDSVQKTPGTSDEAALFVEPFDDLLAVDF